MNWANFERRNCRLDDLNFGDLFLIRCGYYTCTYILQVVQS